MSLEAITRIRSVEEGMDQAKADARAQAQKLAAEAEREGRALLQQGREQAAKAAPYLPVLEYIPTSISEDVYNAICYCQMERGMVILHGDAGIGKTNEPFPQKRTEKQMKKRNKNKIKKSKVD